MKIERSEAIKLAILTIILVIFFTISFHFIISKFDISKLKDFVNSFGLWGPLVILAVIIITSSIGLIFSIPVAISALVMNVYEAFFISVIGLSIGALINFYVSRYLGRDYVEQKFIHKIKAIEKYDKKLQKKGFITILLLRFIILIPFEIINVLAGFSRVGGLSFFLATLIGIIPGVVLTIYFIHNTSNLESFQFFIATFLYTSFSLVPLLSRKIRRILFDIR